MTATTSKGDPCHPFVPPDFGDPRPLPELLVFVVARLAGPWQRRLRRAGSDTTTHNLNVSPFPTSTTSFSSKSRFTSSSCSADPSFGNQDFALASSPLRLIGRA